MEFIIALFVGIYSTIIALLLPFNNTILFLFVTGFFKHFLGGILGFHDIYCKQNFNINTINLILESLIEGLFFILFGYLLPIDYPFNIFFIGFILHIIFDLLKLHTFFCKYRTKIIYLISFN